MFKLNKLGTIVDGKYKDWAIVIQEEKNNLNEVCGYIIAYWDKKGNEGYDDWCDSKEDVEALLDEAFNIEWSEDDYVPKAVDEKTLKKVEEFQTLAKKKGF